MTISKAPVSIELTNKGLISDQLWNRLINRIIQDENLDLALAQSIMDQALGFLRLCAKTTDESFSPSPLVDIGWHTFILYTRDYAEFCERIARRFIHHAPSDEENTDYGPDRITRTVAALKQHGIAVDEELWAQAPARSIGPRCKGGGGDGCGGGGCGG
jgi:hypothetical protein